MIFDFTVKNFLLGSGTGSDTPMFQFYKRGFGTGNLSQPSWKDVVISGIGSLTLVNAKANGLNYLKLFGKCEQNGTPTPSNPVDIVCNNGTIKVKDDELPLGYKRLSYIESSGVQIIDTNYVLQETDSVEVDYNITNRSRTGDKFILGCQPILDNPNIGMWVETSGSQNGWYVRFGSISSVYVASTTSQLSGTLKISKGSFVVNGVKILQPKFTGMSPNQMSIFNRRTSDGSVPTTGCSAQVRSVRILNGNNIIRKYIPCESPDNILGLYEVTQGEFLTNNGRGDFTAGSYDTSHLTEIYYDGTVETVSVFKNLVDEVVEKKFVRAGKASESNPLGREGSDNNWCCTEYIAVEPNTEYTTVSPSYIPATGAGLVFFSDTTFESAISGVSAQRQGGAVYKFTTPEDCHFLRFSYPRETGLKAVMYENSNLQTATAEPLLAVGNYKDVQEIKTGNITRNCEVLIYDGTQTINNPYMSTTGGLDVGAIIVHPKTTPTTETVTPQPMQIQAGTNIVEITQASLNNLELEVSYKAGVEVTVEEIENAQLDNSVEVTING